MTKYYLSHKATELDDPKLEMLLNIANEIAEHNRLKRLELEENILHNEIVTTAENFDIYMKDISKDMA